MKKMNVGFFALLILVSLNASALDLLPKCYDGHRELPLMNEEVIQYKKTMPNLKKIQVFVKATFVRELPPTFNQYGHHQHFIVALREDIKDPAGLIEISHSMNGYTFPEASDLSKGPVYICGEYSTTDVNGFPKITKFIPSETGAMLHWTHQAGKRKIEEKSDGHPNGWIFSEGKIFGRYERGMSLVF